MTLIDTMPHRCTIRRKRRSSGSLAGSKTTPTVEQTGVHCWEQNAGHAETLDYQKRGMTINRKIYFATDPAVDTRHEILITERDGVAVASPLILEVRSESLPDAAAGRGTVYKVMAEEMPGKRT